MPIPNRWTDELLVAWVAAALADGWTLTPTYENHEAVERAGTLAHPDGSRVSYINRPFIGRNGQPDRSLSVSAWGPDKVELSPLPTTYTPGLQQALVRHCPVCGKDDVTTERVAFANRACTECAPALRQQLCKGNWTN